MNVELHHLAHNTLFVTTHLGHSRVIARLVSGRLVTDAKVNIAKYYMKV
jgi:hypothetical protein